MERLCLINRKEAVEELVRWESVVIDCVSSLVDGVGVMPCTLQIVSRGESDFKLGGREPRRMGHIVAFIPWSIRYKSTLSSWWEMDITTALAMVNLYKGEVDSFIALMAPITMCPGCKSLAHPC